MGEKLLDHIYFYKLGQKELIYNIKDASFFKYFKNIKNLKIDLTYNLKLKDKLFYLTKIPKLSEFKIFNLFSNYNQKINFNENEFITKINLYSNVKLIYENKADKHTIQILKNRNYYFKKVFHHFLNNSKKFNIEIKENIEFEKKIFENFQNLNLIQFRIELRHEYEKFDFDKIKLNQEKFLNDIKLIDFIEIISYEEFLNFVQPKFSDLYLKLSKNISKLDFRKLFLYEDKICHFLTGNSKFYNSFKFEEKDIDNLYKFNKIEEEGKKELEKNNNKEKKEFEKMEIEEEEEEEENFEENFEEFSKETSDEEYSDSEYNEIQSEKFEKLYLKRISYFKLNNLRYSKSILSLFPDKFKTSRNLILIQEFLKFYFNNKDEKIIQINYLNEKILELINETNFEILQFKYIYSYILFNFINLKFERNDNSKIFSTNILNYLKKNIKIAEINSNFIIKNFKSIDENFNRKEFKFLIENIKIKTPYLKEINLEEIFKLLNYNDLLKKINKFKNIKNESNLKDLNEYFIKFKKLNIFKDKEPILKFLKNLKLINFFNFIIKNKYNQLFYLDQLSNGYYRIKYNKVSKLEETLFENTKSINGFKKKIEKKIDNNNNNLILEKKSKLKNKNINNDFKLILVDKYGKSIEDKNIKIKMNNKNNKNIKNSKELQNDYIMNYFEKLNLKFINTDSDGHCLFKSIMGNNFNQEVFYINCLLFLDKLEDQLLESGDLETIKANYKEIYLKFKTFYFYRNKNLPERNWPNNDYYIFIASKVACLKINCYFINSKGKMENWIFNENAKTETFIFNENNIHYHKLEKILK